MGHLPMTRSSISSQAGQVESYLAAQLDEGLGEGNSFDVGAAIEVEGRLYLDVCGACAGVDDAIGGIAHLPGVDALGVRLTAAVIELCGAPPLEGDDDADGHVGFVGLDANETLLPMHPRRGRSRRGNVAALTAGSSSATVGLAGCGRGRVSRGWWRGHSRYRCA